MKSAPTPKADITSCQRCGTCCRKGGPGLHLGDRPLVDSGKIPLKHLLTIRQGEPAFDNVTGHIAPAVTDILIIKGIHGNVSDCVFYDRSQKGCTIYDHRPVECQALECWDTREIESIYNSRRLTRRHLLSKVQGLWELVEDHQDRCDYAYVAELAAKIRRSRRVEEAAEELLALIRYDRHLREVTLERAKLDPGMLTFLFGRPLSFTIKLFKLQMKKTALGMVLEPSGDKGAQVCYRKFNC